MMQLPGGIERNGQIHRDFQFKTLTGEQQLEISESIAQSACFPDCVSRVLSCCLQTLVGEPPSIEQLDSLSVGDRQFLMRQLAIKMDDSEIWLNANCHHCEQTFDLAYQQSKLPVKLADDSYPVCRVESSLGALRVRCINGADQRAVALLSDRQEAIDALLERIVSIEILDQDDDAKRQLGAIDSKNLSNEDRTLIETSVEKMSPEVTDCLTAYCPHCESLNNLEIDPNRCIYNQNTDLISEVHRIASEYHWSEQDILCMPVQRRERYLSLIAHNNGEPSHASSIMGGT